MPQQARIYGRGNCPHTRRALDAYGQRAEFRDILANPEHYDEMMRLSDHSGRIPVIVEADGTVLVGFNRGS